MALHVIWWLCFLFETSRATWLLSHLATFFISCFSFLLTLFMYNFNDDNQHIGCTVFSLENALYSKGCVHSGISGCGCFFFFLFSAIPYCNTKRFFSIILRKTQNNLKNLKDCFCSVFCSLLTGLASEIQSSCGLWCQILLLPHVQGCCLHGVETVFCSRPVW